MDKLELLRSRMKKIEVKSPDEFIQDKLAKSTSPVSEVAEEPEEVRGKKRIRDAITDYTKKIDKSSVVKSVGSNAKENMGLSEKSKFAVERGVKLFELSNQSDYKEVTRQRAIEFYFLCGEMVSYLASKGDKKAIEMLEICKASGITDDRVYRFK